MDTIKKITPVDAEVIEQKSKDIIPVENEIVKTDADIDGFIELRQDFIKKVNAICIEGKDYHIIQGKKSLAKGGAEKIASIFKWTAKFEKDSEALEMLGIEKGLVAFKCTLTNGGFVGEGRGAAYLVKNGGDPNKTLKMAQKSAFIDAVLRASGLSDFFTQDLEDMPKEQISQTFETSTPATGVPPSKKQIDLIHSLIIQKRPTKKELANFPPIDQLTGGKGGTASQMIDFLMKHMPSDTINTTEEGSKYYFAFMDAESPEDVKMVYDNLLEAKPELTDDDKTRINSAYKDAVRRTQDSELMKVADTLDF